MKTSNRAKRGDPLATKPQVPGSPLARKAVSAVCCALVMAVAAFAGAVAAPTFLHWNAERASLDCARKSEGTDMAIAECYWQHGLPTPEDI